VTALSHALAPDFAGDRVAAFIVACADTIVTAHGGKREFYYLDGIDPQHLYNAARNMEIALWILNTRRDAQGQPLLLANEIGPDSRNLSFEREFRQDHRPPGPVGQLRHRALPPRRDRLRAGRGARCACLTLASPEGDAASDRRRSGRGCAWPAELLDIRCPPWKN
jgi:hypothetical protein